MVTLDDLALRHGTDKGSRSFRHLSAKHYTKRYDRLFAARRDEPIRLIEIGVASGGSLRMWRDYFPRGRIVGIDTDRRCLEQAFGRVSVVLGGQADATTLDTALALLGGAVDIVIDDGSHRTEDHRASFAYLLPRVAPYGVYAIEDLHAAPETRRWLDALAQCPTWPVGSVEVRGSLAIVTRSA